MDPIYIRVARAIDAGYLTKPEIMTYTGLSLSVCTNAITNLWKHGALESSQPRTTKSRGAKYTLRIPVERLVRDFQRPKTLSHDMTVPELERAWPMRKQVEIGVAGG